MDMDKLLIAGHEFESRLLLGTGKFSSFELMQSAIASSGAQIVTVALRRMQPSINQKDISGAVAQMGVTLMPNTSGARTAKEALLAAELAREATGSNWVKVEIHPDARYLMPDPIETFLACELLVAKEFIVLPYVHADPVLCKRLAEVGVAAVMPLAAPIGSNRGLDMRAMLEIIIEQSTVPVIVDAGLGAPSHAALALELGADAVLVNTAIAAAADPVAMAKAFRLAVIAGRAAFLAGLARPTSAVADASSPLTSFLFAGDVAANS